ncbi:hypothetical protein UA3_01857 [Enterococcus faecium EnGen0263]|uniref:hypothetical protein n=1 Tax=Enterococcus TaxID=1350 RepID=UPI00032E6D20|nr:hypothetical protein [Enterococcus faecium]EOH55527.1 hypothetical protein UA3_01857 [Enterococcus faecium EnGen0263]MCS8593961.1 hypothetical protein [Enterococcus faecium]
MSNIDWIKDALESKSDLKVIMKGSVEKADSKKIGVTSIVFVSKDKEKTQQVYQKLIEKEPDNFFMIYAVNLNEMLENKSHYPSIAIYPEDLQI